MRRVYTILLILLPLLLTGCNDVSNQEDLLVNSFKLPDIDQQHLEVDDAVEYFQKLEDIENAITFHDVYPKSIYDNLQTRYLNMSSNGFGINDYDLYDQTLFFKYEPIQVAFSAVGIIRNFIDFGDFTENLESNYYGTTCITFANDNYLEYSCSSANEEIVLKLVVTDDNIIYDYYRHNGSTTTYYKNDFSQGFLQVHIYSNDETNRHSYSYNFLDYSKNLYEGLYINKDSTVNYYVKDLANGLYINSMSYSDGTTIDIDFLSNNHIELGYFESSNSSGNSYNIKYNLKNLTGWDFYKSGNLYSNDNTVLTDYLVHYHPGFGDLVLTNRLTSFSESDFNNIDGSNYIGPFTYQDIVTAKALATEQLEKYYLEVSDDDTFYYIDSVRYTFDELIASYKQLINYPN